MGGLRASVGFGAVHEQICEILDNPVKTTYRNVGGFAPLYDHQGIVECSECAEGHGTKLTWTMNYTTPWWLPSVLPTVGMESVIPVFVKRVTDMANAEAART